MNCNQYRELDFATGLLVGRQFTSEVEKQTTSASL